MSPTQTQTIPILQTIRQNRDQILAIFAKHNCDHIRLFGSVAHNQATQTSDIDFMCDHDPTQRTPWFPMGLIEDLETLLGYSRYPFPRPARPQVPRPQHPARLHRAMKPTSEIA